MYTTNSRTTTIKIESTYDRRAKALCILLGGYNKYGTKIPLEKYTEILKKHENIVGEIENLLCEHDINS